MRAGRADPTRMTRYWTVRVVAGHRYTAAALLIGLAAFLALQPVRALSERVVLAWDIAALALLALFTVQLFAADDTNMERNAEAQEEGEWTVFCVTLVGVVVSFAALSRVMALAKDVNDPFARKLTIALVVATLFLSWLTTHVIFALRYAHEYYQRSDDRAASVDRGLDFPGGQPPDYWDFLYFSLVLGMTFQVSDVQITSRKLRRLATAHGMVGFLFNTVVIALTVNIASSLL